MRVYSASLLKGQELRSFYLHSFLGRKCSHGIAPLPKSTSPELPLQCFQDILPHQGILRNTMGMFILICSCLLLPHLQLHNSSTPENKGTNFCKVNLTVIAVIPLKVWLFASFIYLELLKPASNSPITKVETL